MWVSRRLRRGTEVETAADLGVTTIAGKSVGVMTRGEMRQLPVYGPGGIHWVPENGSSVLVIQGGTGGQECCVAGAEQKNTPKDLLPGELYLQSKNTSIRLRNNGRIEIWGSLYINGELYGSD